MTEEIPLLLKVLNGMISALNMDINFQTEKKGMMGNTSTLFGN